ncbi:single-stranded DNA-binding protein [Sanguibacter sp. A247]|uniref:single-stranded DNA-binding protein n=1 Tax=unclassified Sanguibacter TaxID=2645534 RepID=UPI003FD85EC5
MSAPVTIIGWVGNKPAITVTANERRRTTVRVATTHRFRDEHGTWTDGETTWYSATFWDDAAASVAVSVHIGDPVILTGRLVLDRWDGTDGPRAELALRGATIGHDLTRGQAQFTRVIRTQAPVEGASDGAPEGAFTRIGPDDESGRDPFDVLETEAASTGARQDEEALSASDDVVAGELARAL